MTDFRFESPLVLVVAGPLWVGLVALVFWVQRRSVEWIDRSVSARFRSVFTIYGPVTFYLHALLLVVGGLALITAAAAPYKRGTIEVTRTSPYVVFLVDASLSMEAQDVDAPSWDGKKKAKVKRVSRLSAAKSAVEGLAQELGGDAHIGLISFSGVSAIHIPPTNDQTALREAFAALNTHYFENTGTNFKGAFETAFHFFPAARGRSQIVVFSDGEVPNDAEDLSDTLGVLKASGVSVWTVGIGSNKGYNLGIYSPDDLRKGVTKPSVIRRVDTKRIESTLKDMSKATGGKYLRIEDFDAEWLAKRIREWSEKKSTIPTEGRESLASGLIWIFLVILLVELLLLESRFIVPALDAARRTAAHAWTGMIRLRAARGTAVLLAGFFLAGCRFDACQAHALNENGILFHSGKAFHTAAGSFESSAEYHFREEIPLFNLGNTYMSQRDYSQAHATYEKSLRIKPEFAQALFNDGEALFVWGQREIDPEGCRLDRTRQLWKESKARFEAAAQNEPTLKLNADANVSHLDSLMKELDLLAAQCPPEKKKQKEEEQKQEQQKREQEKKEQEQKEREDQKKKQEPDQPKGPQPSGEEGKDIPSKKRGKITPQEAEQIGKELERIQKQKQGKRHNQTRPQQFRAPEEGKADDGSAGGREVLW